MYSCRYTPNRIYKVTPIVTVPTTEPVTLEDVKDWLTVTYLDDDDLLTALIAECRDGMEQFLTLSLVAKTLTIDADLYREQELPFGPISALTSVMWRNGTIYEATTDYDFDAESGIFLPGIAGRFKIVATAGPMDLVNYASLRADLKRIIGYCYDNRGDQELTSLQNGVARPAGLDQALELFASKYKSMAWL